MARQRHKLFWMGSVKVENMRPPKKKNVEKLERYVEKLKEKGKLRDHDA